MAASTRSALRTACRIVAVCVAAYLATGYCSTCEAHSGWPLGVVKGLIYAGLASSLAQLTLGVTGERAKREQLSDTADAILCLTILGSAGLLAAYLSTGVKACSYCLAFWTAQLVLFLELVQSRRLLAKSGTFTMAGVSACTAIFLVFPIARLSLASALPTASVILSGPHAESPAPEEAQVRDGVVICVTTCTRCLQNSVARVVKVLEKRSVPLSLICTATEASSVQAATGVLPVVVNSSLFVRREVALEGPPMVVTIQSGVVKRCDPVSDFESRLRQ